MRKLLDFTRPRGGEEKVLALSVQVADDLSDLKGRELQVFRLGSYFRVD
jgi:hypothetical protein